MPPSPKIAARTLQNKFLGRVRSAITHPCAAEGVDQWGATSSQRASHGSAVDASNPRGDVVMPCARILYPILWTKFSAPPASVDRVSLMSPDDEPLNDVNETLAGERFSLNLGVRAQFRRPPAESGSIRNALQLQRGRAARVRTGNAS